MKFSTFRNILVYLAMVGGLILWGPSGLDAPFWLRIVGGIPSAVLCVIVIDFVLGKIWGLPGSRRQ